MNQSYIGVLIDLKDKVLFVGESNLIMSVRVCYQLGLDFQLNSVSLVFKNVILSP